MTQKTSSIKREFFAMSHLKARDDMRVDPSERSRFVHEQNIKQYQQQQYNTKLINDQLRAESQRLERIRRAREHNSNVGQNVDVEA